MEEKLKEIFEDVEIPEELDEVIEKAIQTANQVKQDNVVVLKPNNRRIGIMKKFARHTAASIAVLTLTFAGAANFSPTFAQSMSEIPVLKELVKVVTFGQYEYDTADQHVKVNTPVIEGLSNIALQDELNEKYIAQNKMLFEAFKQEGQRGLDVNSEVVTDNDQLLVVANKVTTTGASASEQVTYTTIDKQNEIVVTLPSLFQDSRYIENISENILEQMKEKMVQDENNVFWVEKSEEKAPYFTSIDQEQTFYITEEGKLVVVFDECTVAPAYMGVQEFVIPTDVIQDVLVSNTYIK